MLLWQENMKLNMWFWSDFYNQGDRSRYLAFIRDLLKE